MIKRIVDRQIARLRRASRPWRHNVGLAAATLLTPGMRLPLQPWARAPMPESAEVVARLPGGFEAPRRVRIFGDQRVELAGVTLERTDVLVIRRLRDVILLPHRVMLSQHERKVLPPTFDLPTNSGFFSMWQDPVGSYSYRRYAPLRNPPRVITEPLLLADTQHSGFGHQLLEMTPMLMARETLPTRPRIATTFAPIAALAAPFGVTAENRLPIDRPLFCSEVYVPEPPLVLPGRLHSVARDAFQRLANLGATSTVETPERLFISRLNWGGRTLLNEVAVQELFGRYGFVAIAPEELSIADQTRLFANARMVAGAGGSAMHNLVFSPPSTKALLLTSPHWTVNIDRFIARADDQFGFVIGTTEHAFARNENFTHPFAVDLALVEHAIHEHFGL